MAEPNDRDTPADTALRIMREADRRFSELLEAAYGAKAGDMRYRRTHANHPEIAAAGAAFVDASNAWRAALHSEPFIDGSTHYDTSSLDATRALCGTTSQHVTVTRAHVTCSVCRKMLAEGLPIRENSHVIAP